MRVTRSAINIKSDSSRVLLRPLNPIGNERQLRIIARILSLSEQEVYSTFMNVMNRFAGRHRDLQGFLFKRFESVMGLLPTDAAISKERQLLIGSYFSQEYSIEGAALFNPSMVVHPDQSNIANGSVRFVLSLRATGEGHISSVTFREGMIDHAGEIHLEPINPFVTAPSEIRHSIDKALFTLKLETIGISHSAADAIVQVLPDSFSVDQLAAKLDSLKRRSIYRTSEFERAFSRILSLAQANYDLKYTSGLSLSERILFPTSPLESHGLEDARFVRFEDEEGQIIYYATYTAYNGHEIIPQIIETKDFREFGVSTLLGPEIQNKGMALFPRKIDGRYAMISRQDGENLHLMYSDDIHFWFAKTSLLRPTFPWEFVQIGNCGSPLETPEGWLVLTHGVGAMREYTLGAFLLDLHNPSKVIGRLERPFLLPNEQEREGYVPNVVYSCGGIIKDELLVLPYAMSDNSSSFVTVPWMDLIEEMKM